MSSRLIAGAMSGTSADGVDVALVQVSGRGLEMSAKLAHHCHQPYTRELREGIFGFGAGWLFLYQFWLGLGREISLAYAAAIHEAVRAAGMTTADLAAVAAHGQTLYHDPPNTIQWFDPALVAAEVGTTVVSDFRRADCAAGGQGAPLVPLADYLLFRDPKKHRVLLNLGGIANITFLRAGGPIADVIAFDTGPGNCISDHLMRQFVPDGAGVDEGGRRAAAGVAVDPIVERVLAAPYFSFKPPKSTDGPAMITLFTGAQLGMGRTDPIEDLLRSALEISADSVVHAIRRFISPSPDELIVSGGGIGNETLMSLIRQRLEKVSVRTSDELGVPSQAKEAIAFALLGAATLDGIPGNVPTATGARRAVVLGAVTPKP